MKKTHTQWGKDSLFNKLRWENWIPTSKRMQLDPYLASYKKLTQSCIRPEAVKLLEGNKRKAS